MQRLDDVCILITDGTHYSPKDEGVGLPFVTVKDMSEVGLDFDNCIRISEEVWQKADDGNSAPRSGDVLLSKDGTVGKVHVVKNEGKFAALSSIAILRPNPEILNPDYLGHFLKSEEAMRQASQMKTGTALRRIILKDIKRIQLHIPSMKEQKRIATILDKADEINNGVENSQNLRDSFLSSVFLEMFGDPILNPKGWEQVSLGNIVHFHYGKALKADERDGDGPFNVYGSNGVVGQHSEKIVDYDTIVIGRKGSVGKVTMALGGGWPIDTTYFVEIKDEGAVNLKYLYHSLELANLVRYSITTSIPGINRKTLNSVEIMLPPSQLMSQFEKICSKFSSNITHDGQVDNLVNSITQELLVNQ